MGRGQGPLQKTILRKLKHNPEGLPICILTHRIYGKKYTKTEYQNVWNAVRRLYDRDEPIVSFQFQILNGTFDGRKILKWIFLYENWEKNKDFLMNLHQEKNYNRWITILNP